jgi:hypothetical protein
MGQAVSFAARRRQHRKLLTRRDAADARRSASSFRRSRASAWRAAIATIAVTAEDLAGIVAAKRPTITTVLNS